MEAPAQKNTSAQKQLFFKLGFILVFILLLLIPVAWIQSLIEERESLQRNVEQEVAASWGQEQTIRGPVLCIPYEKTVYVDNKAVLENHWFYLTPETLKINAGIATEIRTKGIFNTVVFEGNNHLEGAFDLSLLPTPDIHRYQLDEAILITGVSDPSAVTQKIGVQWNNQEQQAIPGTKNSDFIKNGFHSPAPVSPGQTTCNFDIQLTIRGTSSLHFMPSGRVSTITAQSPWPSPSFTGRNLPAKRNITSQGFDATWTASEYNRPFPTYWSDSEFVAAGDQGTFGVKLIQTADFYQKNMRSAKYAILVIALSFMSFFFFEMMLKIRIHPIQYILIGLSLAIFYALLLSFTEHVGFNLAYLISFSAVFLLIAAYAFAIFKTWRPILILSCIFTMLYGYIFVLLQLEDYALLAGSVGLFFILASVMLLSRKIDWYNYDL